MVINARPATLTTSMVGRARPLSSHCCITWSDVVSRGGVLIRSLQISGVARFWRAWRLCIFSNLGHPDTPEICMVYLQILGTPEYGQGTSSSVALNISMIDELSCFAASSMRYMFSAWPNAQAPWTFSRGRSCRALSLWAHDRKESIMAADPKKGWNGNGIGKEKKTLANHP